MKHVMLNQIKIVAILLLAFVGCTEKETQVEVSSVSLNTATIEMVEGETFSLVATVLPKDAEYDGVIWASSNASVARVNSGTVTAIKEGITTITASAGGKSATCSVKVSTRVVAVKSITLDKTSLSMKVGATETITATVNPDNATDKTVTWGSSDVSVATVADGIVTAKSPGTVTVTAKSGIYTTDCNVTVTVDIESLSLDKTNLSLSIGETAQLTATVKPDDATDKNVSWTSSDESVAKVDNGKVTAVKSGKATIIAKCGDKTAECEVTVYAKVTGVKLSSSSLRMMSGDKALLKATITPDNAMNKNISWSSDNETVAVVNNGEVTAKAEGKATITVTTEDGQYTATCSVTVTNDITSYVYAEYYGGSMSIINDLIQYGSKLNFGVKNNSKKTIKVKSVQLIDGVTEAKGNVMNIGYEIEGGSSAAWSITIGIYGIHKPIAEFIYEYEGNEYSTRAQYREIRW